MECGASLPKGRFTRNHIMKAEKVNRFRFKYDNIGVYQTAYYYDSEDQKEANLIGDFYIDLDYELDVKNAEDAFDVVRQDAMNVARYLKTLMGIQPEDLYFFFSGSKGVHIIVPYQIFGVKPHKNLNSHYKMLAEDINKYTSGKTMDLKIYDNRRLFRMPNSVHQKTKLYKTYITYEELKTMKFEEIKELAKQPRVVPKKKVSKNLKASMELNNCIEKFKMKIGRNRVRLPSDMNLEYTPPCVKYLLENPVGKGQRNDTVAFLASFFRQTGATIEESINKLLSWNEEFCEPRLSDREIEITTNSIYSGDSKMGCSTAKTISECDQENCKLYDRRPKWN